ncbi:serine-type enodpeptidase-like protein [Dinothrombium tinctorium]|uniref:Serine-type enodpeptidase-like protein n=1 Tax=Dinothrombium tinctorium TaxID=1965070 RepID=A0A3S3PDV9_9ACAR|nr:serine-type enodpeptidase-like protein [Dinothrombium tinctorium]
MAMCVGLWATFISFLTFNFVNGEISCGVNNENGTNANLATKRDAGAFIINGKDAQPGQVPWVALLYIYLQNGRAMCGGAIVDNYTIVSAAHCFFSCPVPFPLPSLIPSLFPRICKNAMVNTIEVCIGERNRTDPNDGQTCFNATKFHIEPRYLCCSDDNTNDIGIIKIPQGMNIPKFTSDGYGSTNRICLPTEYDYTGPGLISGWGRTSSTSQETATVLQIANVDILSNDECKKDWDVTESQVCALGRNGESSCNGDSGSALFTATETGAKMIGITSYGIVNCVSRPVVYTRAFSFLDFINSHSGPEPQNTK